MRPPTTTICHPVTRCQPSRNASRVAMRNKYAFLDAAPRERVHGGQAAMVRSVMGAPKKDYGTNDSLVSSSHCDAARQPQGSVSTPGPTAASALPSELNA